MNQEYRIEIEPEETGQRIDKVLSDRIPELSRSRIQALIDEQGITVNDTVIRASYRVKEGDIAQVIIPAVRSVDIIPENLSVSVLFEDEHLVVVDKPRGMVVHPGAGVDRGTLVHALMFQCHSLSGIGGELRPGIVHRLDKGTSGAMMAAKNDVTHEKLARQFAERRIQKEYWAIVAGNPVWEEFDLDAALFRHPTDRKKMAVVPSGRPARTLFKVIARAENLALVSAHPMTGRTHQIRVHLQHLGHPVLGDSVYGKNALDRFKSSDGWVCLRRMAGFCLHSRSIRFTHPITLRELEFQALVPQDMREVLARGGISDSDWELQSKT